MVISDTTDHVVATVATGGNPYVLTYLPAFHDVAVTLGLANEVAIVSDSTNAVVSTVAVGDDASGMAFDPANGFLYVTNYFQDTVSILTLGLVNEFPVTFQESGLPHGAFWQVAVGPTAAPVGTRASSIVAYAPNGALNYTIYPPANWTVSPTAPPSPGSPLNVSGPVNVTIRFVHLGPLVFREVGLTSSVIYDWSVTVGSPPVIYPSGNYNGYRIVIPEPNGSIPYSVTAPAGWGVAYLTPSSHLSPVLMNGRTVVTVHFGLLEHLYFNETGLPPATNWTVTLTPVRAGGPGGATVTTNGTSVVVVAPAGTLYRWTVAAPGHTPVRASGLVAVSPLGPRTVAVTFH